MLIDTKINALLATENLLLDDYLTTFIRELTLKGNVDSRTLITIDILFYSLNQNFPFPVLNLELYKKLIHLINTVTEYTSTSFTTPIPFPTQITSKHSDLDNLDWVASKHIGTANTVAYFSSIGLASYYDINLKANVAGQVFTGPISSPTLSGTNTGDETLLSIGNLINSGLDKTTPVSTDYLGFRNVVTGLLAKLSWDNLKITLKAYFDTIYSSGAVASVNGTTNRVTSTGGANPVIDISSTFEGLLEKVGNKDITGGYVGLTLFKINFKNAANTITSFFTNNNTTSAKTYTFQDRDGTIADDTDLSLKANLASPTFTGTVTSPNFSGRKVPRIQSITSNSSITPNADNDDVVDITALATNTTFNNPSGTPVNKQVLMIDITPDATPRTLTFSSSSGGYAAGGVTLPTVTIASKIISLLFIYDAVAIKWKLRSLAQEA